MKKELKSGILSADKSADNRPTVGGVHLIAVLTMTLPIQKTATQLDLCTDLTRENPCEE